MNNRPKYVIYEDQLMSVEHADFCELPGYLILRLKTGAQSAGDLKPDEAMILGSLLSSSVAAIEKVVGADRVYCLSFCELDRHLHFHLFPRSAALLVEYQQATGTVEEPVNGPMLFEWARESFPAGARMPPEFPDIGNVCSQLQSLITPDYAT